MKTRILTLHLLLAVVLLAQLSSGEVREKARQRSCRSGSREESCGTEERKSKYEKESQKKHMEDDDDDEDDDESSDEEDDDNSDEDTENEQLSESDGDGVDTGGSKKKREAQEKRTKDSNRSDRRSSEGNKNKEVKGKQNKSPQDATNTGHDKLASKVNKNRNDKRQRVKGDKAKVTGDSVTKKSERNEGTDQKGYDPKKTSMKPDETSRMKRDVGNKGESREQADIGKPKKKGGKYTRNDKDSPETLTVADENVDGSTDDATVKKDRAGKRKYASDLQEDPSKVKLEKLSSVSETDIEGIPVESTGEVDETTATEEVLTADESRNIIPEASDATETTGERDQDTNIDTHETVSDSDDYASSEISSSESTVTPRSYEPPPFPEVTLEFDSSTMLPEHLRTGNSGMHEEAPDTKNWERHSSGGRKVNEEATDTENWESHLSGGRKVEVDVTNEQNEEVIHDSSMDNLEGSEEENQIHGDKSEENSLPLKSVQYTDNSVEAEENLQEADDSRKEETEPELLVQENPDDAFGLDHGKK